MGRVLVTIYPRFTAYDPLTGATWVGLDNWLSDRHREGGIRMPPYLRKALQKDGHLVGNCLRANAGWGRPKQHKIVTRPFVIDRTSGGDKSYVSRDQSFDVAFDLCVRKALIGSMH